MRRSAGRSASRAGMLGHASENMTQHHREQKSDISECGMLQQPDASLSLLDRDTKLTIDSGLFLWRPLGRSRRQLPPASITVTTQNFDLAVDLFGLQAAASIAYVACLPVTQGGFASYRELTGGHALGKMCCGNSRGLHCKTLSKVRDVTQPRAAKCSSRMARIRSRSSISAGLGSFKLRRK
jgi:hypothetical protein